MPQITLTKLRNGLCPLIFILFPSIIVPGSLQAATTTQTSLTTNPQSAVNWPAPVILTSTVLSNGSPVTSGTVIFCNVSANSCSGPALLGQVQVQASGHAALTVALPPGSYAIQARFGGTTNFAASSSASQALTVGNAPTSITLTANAAPPYNPTALVQANSAQPLTGSVTLNDKLTGLTLSTLSLPGFSPNLSLNASTLPGAGNGPASIAIGDFNGDGIPDIVTGALYQNAGGFYTFSLYLSAGPGHYGGVENFELPATFLDPAALAVGDFNGDGNLDLAVVGDNSGTVIILLGDGHGKLSLANNSPITIGATAVPNSIAVADFNGDGHLDLAVTCRSNSNVVILLGAGDGTFTLAPQAPQTDTWPYAIAVGDFNNDGKPDLAVANYFGFDVTVMLGHGDGTFSFPLNFPTGVYPDSVAVGDLNHDGNPDLVVTNQYSNDLTILLGNGSGGFVPTSQSPATGRNPDSTAIADFNGDGIPDLAIASPTDSSITVLKGKGDGTFSLQITIPTGTGTSPYALTSADLNLDGGADLVAAGSGNGTVVLALSSFTAPLLGAPFPGVTLQGVGPHSLQAVYSGNAAYASSSSAIVQLTGQPVQTALSLTASPAGTEFIGQTVQLTATLSPGQIGQLAATGTVSFYNGQTLLATAPVANGIAVLNDTLKAAGTETLSAKYSGDKNFLASASGNSTVSVIAPSPSATTLTLSSTTIARGTTITLTAAVTSGGKPVTRGSVLFSSCPPASASCSGTNRVVLGTMQLTTLGSAVTKLALPVGTHAISAQFTGTASITASSSALQNVTVGSTLSSITSVSTTGTPGNYTLHANIAGSWPAPHGTVSFVDTSNQNLVLATQAVNSFAVNTTSSAHLSAGTTPFNTVTGDFNGDGFTDVITASAQNTGISVFLGNGNGTFTPKTLPVAGNPGFCDVIGMAKGDFNGDGKLDLAVANDCSPGTLFILLGNGDGTFIFKSILLTGSSPVWVVAADFNADGNLDLAVTNSMSNNITILLGNGDGTFLQEAESPVTGAGPIVVVASDFDGDGKADLAVVCELGNSVFVFLGAGDGTFQPQTPIPIATGLPFVMAAADFNGDGTPDLAVAGGAGGVTLLLGNGNGTFRAMPPMLTSLNLQWIAPADFNGDGFTDLVAIENVSPERGDILLNDGHGNFTSASSFSSSAQFQLVATGDFNQDGGPDLAITDNANSLNILLTNVSGSATVSGISVPGSGTHMLQASFAANPPYASSNSNLVPATATPLTTKTVITGTSSVSAGTAVPFSVQVSPVSADNFTLTGTVSLYNGGSLIGTTALTNGQAAFKTTFANPGSYTLKANYSGNANFQASSATFAVTVQAAP